MKKRNQRLLLAKETLQRLDMIGEVVVGGDAADTKSVYWSCVCTNSGMYTCACPTQPTRTSPDPER
jgi:hypothetical protein